MSFPTNANFRSTGSKIIANGNFFKHVSTISPVFTGGPLRKIQIIFGQNSMAYMYAASRNVLKTDTNLTNTPYKQMVNVPFSVFAVDELDSSGGAARQLNVALLMQTAAGPGIRIQ